MPRHLLRQAALAAALAALTTACSRPSRSYIYAWAGADSASLKGSDFLAVIDADSASGTYGRVVATAPVHAINTMPHHTELLMPPAGVPLFASGFMSGQVFLLDLDHPLAPRLARTIDSVPGFAKPHSFWRLPDGNVLATIQYGEGRQPGNPGGLVLFGPRGNVLRTASSADPAFPGAPIHTYALDVAPAVDRVVTTSSPMEDTPTAKVLQVWRLSDLTRLATLALPQVPGDTTTHLSFETRILRGDTTALVTTWRCGLYLLSGLTTSPRVELLFALPRPANNGCGVPLLVGHWFILPVASMHHYLVYDVTDPRHLRQAGVLAVDTTFYPHWMSPEPGTNRVVLTSDEKDHRVLIARFDSLTGVLSLDSTFRDRGANRPGVDFARHSWPHGDFGPAMPHGAVFSRRS